tara:strand:- start:213 stop:698 length:486 start_codon:yes stop_codon:yes gene_type:complete
MMTKSTYRKKCIKGISKPDKKKIAKHYNTDVNVCMACGVLATTDRAHIVPLQCGGSNEIYNLNLLCKPCHAESENLFGREYEMWITLKNEFYTHGAYNFPFGNDAKCRFLILDRIIRSAKNAPSTLNIKIPEEGFFYDKNPLTIYIWLNNDIWPFNSKEEE